MRIREITQEEKQVIASSLFRLENVMFSHKIDKNNYEIFCPNCQEYHTVDANLMKQIKFSKLCPFCFNELTKIANSDYYSKEFYVLIDDYFGYHTTVEWSYHNKPIALDCWQCMYLDKEISKISSYYGHVTGRTGYVMGIGLSVYGHSILRYPERPWSHTNSLYYWRNCYDFNYIATKYEPVIITKKKYLESLGRERFKSNQYEIIKKNLVNKEQCELIRAFDLKSYDDLYKRRAFYKKCFRKYDYDRSSTLAEMIPLNATYLDYIIKNCIHIKDFSDYCKDMNYLGIKVGKPKDFNNEHYNMSLEVKAKKNDSYNPEIAERSDKLPTYSKDNITISPFKNSREIVDCANRLHNCIATYIEKYAKGNTDLYHLDDGGELKVAIEIRNGRLVQAKADHNRDCDYSLMSNIKSFCEMNGFLL